MKWTKIKNDKKKYRVIGGGFRTRIQMCEGKMKYDKKGAVTAKNHAMNERGVWVRVYYHEVCNGWHLTHTKHYNDV
jgi:hypothetical protein